MSFKDLEQFIEPLILPIRGKEYRIPPLGSIDGMKLSEHLANPAESAMTNVEFQTLMLGDVYEQMIADNLPPAYIARAALTALADIQGSRGAAEVMWETGGDPKAVKGMVDSLRDAMTPPAVATTTKRRATGTGTRTSRKN